MRSTQLTILQVNVDKSWRNHEEALRLADHGRYDVVLLQEPCCGNNEQNFIPKNKNYRAFSPVTHWPTEKTGWPGVLTYTRITSNLAVHQIRQYAGRDILVIQVNKVKIINIYNHTERQAVRQVIGQPAPSGKVLLAGDWNARHPSWEPGCTPTPRAGELVKWVDENELILHNKPGTATTARGTVIDLVFSNIAAQTTIEEHLTCGSYHHTLLTTVPNANAATNNTRPKKPRVRTDEELQLFAKAVQTGAAHFPGPPKEPKDIDTLCKAITDCLQTAAAIAGKTPSNKPQKCFQWWSDECKAARLELISVRRTSPFGFNYDIQLARRNLCRAVRRAKKKHKEDFLNSIQTPADIYKLTRWEKATVLVEPPPLEANGRIYSTQQERASALKEHLLDRRDATDDLARPDLAVRPDRNIPINLEVTLEVTRRAVLGAGNTTPGADGITRNMLKAAWEHIGPAVTALYGACLRLGYHPKDLRSAEIVMIPKPNKRNLSLPGSWRPISLLKCLSKGLERLVARRELSQSGARSIWLPP